MTAGRKFDAEKPQFGFLPVSAVRVMVDGSVGVSASIIVIWSMLDSYGAGAGLGGLWAALKSTVLLLSEPGDVRGVTGLTQVVRVLEHGAAKYEPGNWRRVTPPSRYYHAACRHLLQVPTLWDPRANPVALDLDSKFDERAHAACCMAFMVDFEARGISCRPESQDRA